MYGNDDVFLFGFCFILDVIILINYINENYFKIIKSNIIAIAIKTLGFISKPNDLILSEIDPNMFDKSNFGNDGNDKFNFEISGSVNCTMFSM